MAKQEQAELRASLQRVFAETMQVLRDTHKGVPVREYVERWDRAWAARDHLIAALEAADAMLNIDHSIEDRTIEHLGTLLGLTRSFLEEMAEDQAPTFEQRTTALLEQIADRVTAVEGKVDHLSEQIEAGL